MRYALVLFFCLVLLSLLNCDRTPEAQLTGELKTWHNITLTFSGPETSEQDSLNPFLDYRLVVTFLKGDRKYVVPGYYAADGNAAETGSESGSKWRVHFVPDTTGTWHFRADFKTGENIALNPDPNAGEFVAFGKITGRFDIGESNKTGRDFRSKGMLRYAGEHYLQFSGDKDYFLKGGANSPENFLAYYEFDQTPDKHRYGPHIGDWHSSDPTWRDGKGKSIIGALNYLASKGMNAVYMLPMNVDGDGNDVWPWISPKKRYRYDCSKLDQWEIVFSHADSLGIMLHFVLSEAENSNLFEWEELGERSKGFANSRKLFYREMIARFGHHLGVTWNLGEENNQRPQRQAANFDAAYPNTTQQRKEFAAYIRGLDPYDHIITVHNDAWNIFQPLYGNPSFEGPSLQVHDPKDVYEKTLEHRLASANAGKNWVVFLDENGHFNTGAVPDADDPNHDEMRKQVLWANLMAGGAGVEWYFGYQYPHNDLNCEDWRSRDRLWEQTRHALDFFQKYVPFHEMKPMTNAVSDSAIYCFGKAGQSYVVYLPEGGNTELNLPVAKGFTVKWYNPRTGGDLEDGIVTTVYGAGPVSLGLPPREKNKDWAVLVERIQN